MNLIVDLMWRGHLTLIITHYTKLGHSVTALFTGNSVFRVRQDYDFLFLPYSTALFIAQTKSLQQKTNAIIINFHTVNLKILRSSRAMCTVFTE